MNLSTDSSLVRCVREWNPPVTRSMDSLLPGPAIALNAALGLGEQIEMHTLPLLWHWLYFLEWAPANEIGLDGHPEDGPLLPPLPSRRRMFAGSSVEVNEPLIFGRQTSKTSSVTSTGVKSGRTGELLFVTVRSEYCQDGVCKLTEEQDLVYRSGEGSMVPTRSTDTLTDASHPWSHDPTFTSTVLFRFSALTANSHRIHYDEGYATETERYPALVVHGPLLAIHMAQLLSHNEQRSVRKFSFRLTRPVFLGDRVRIQGGLDTDGTAGLEVSSGPSTVHASAKAELA